MAERREGRGPARRIRSSRDPAQELAVALFDLAWLLPRTVGAEERAPDPLPRSELEVMRLLGRRPGTGVNTLARELGLQPSNVSASVRSLAGRGLVERRPSPDDGRQVLLFLTPAAEASRAERERRWGHQLDSLLGLLTDADRARVLDAVPALVAIAQHLAGQGTEMAAAAQVPRQATGARLATGGGSPDPRS